MQHTLQRTSPKGGKFVGRCSNCGLTGLTIANMNDECENPSQSTPAEEIPAALAARRTANVP